ncbi:cytochrome P450 [Funiculus sociatus GB2-A5]|uniref:Cytochrome P450 n=1 Tax=Funiculus sociatus GB2-A5 TaxID=2933946 RepID=A0ABV0JJL8_9CYAN|nr:MULTISPECIES: hypothetical protein [Cyanophyceae]MBD2065720.1 hypothetical protein [Trichocoleus sp. FACHB-6]
MAFAILEIKLILVTIGSLYQLALSDSPVKPLPCGVALAPLASMRMFVTSKRYDKSPTFHSSATSA